MKTLKDSCYVTLTFDNPEFPDRAGETMVVPMHRNMAEKMQAANETRYNASYSFLWDTLTDERPPDLNKHKARKNGLLHVDVILNDDNFPELKGQRREVAISQIAAENYKLSGMPYFYQEQNTAVKADFDWSTLVAVDNVKKTRKRMRFNKRAEVENADLD